MSENNPTGAQSPATAQNMFASRIRESAGPPKPVPTGNPFLDAMTQDTMQANQQLAGTYAHAFDAQRQFLTWALEQADSMPTEQGKDYVLALLHQMAEALNKGLNENVESFASQILGQLQTASKPAEMDPAQEALFDKGRWDVTDRWALGLVHKNARQEYIARYGHPDPEQLKNYVPKHTVSRIWGFEPKSKVGFRD